MNSVSGSDAGGRKEHDGSDGVEVGRKKVYAAVDENGDATMEAPCSGTLADPTPYSNHTIKTESSPSDGSTDTNLDERIRLALNELDFPEGNYRTSNSSASRAHNNRTSRESSESDSEEDEASPDEMGYMPLPQEPDMDGDDSGDCEDGVHQIPIQQQATADAKLIVDSCSGSSGRTEMSGPESLAACKLKPRSAPKEQLPEEAKSAPSASRLKDDEVENIKKAMSGFALPSSSVPEWAKHVPEDIWKSELMDGLHGKLKKT